MIKLFAFAVVAFVVGGSLYDFPRPCYDARIFGACVRAQAHALATLTYKPNSVLGAGVNWEDPRVITR